MNETAVDAGKVFVSSRIELNLPYMSFGGAVGLLSFVKSIEKPIQFNIDPNCGTLVDLIRIFNISNDQLTLNFNSPSNTISLEDNAKTFSPYLKPDQLNLFGNTFPVNKLDKPCIGIVVAPTARMANTVYTEKSKNSVNDPTAAFTHWLPKYPHSKKHVDKIISLCLDLGYDVVTFNSVNIDLDHKILMMNNLCDCLITYEGGLAHLAHCLDIPVIMFPWEKDHEMINNHGLPEFVNITKAMLMHLDKKTYFLPSADEVLTWTADTLNKIKNDLHNNLGNNTLLSSDIKNLASQLDIDQLMDLLLIPKDLKELVKDNLTPFKIGGYN